MQIYNELESDVAALIQKQYNTYEKAMTWMRLNKKGAKAAMKTQDPDRVFE